MNFSQAHEDHLDPDRHMPAFDEAWEDENARLKEHTKMLIAALSICRTALYIENEFARKPNQPGPHDYALDEADKALEFTP